MASVDTTEQRTAERAAAYAYAQEVYDEAVKGGHLEHPLFHAGTRALPEVRAASVIEGTRILRQVLTGREHKHFCLEERRLALEYIAQRYATEKLTNPKFEADTFFKSLHDEAARIEFIARDRGRPDDYANAVPTWAVNILEEEGSPLRPAPAAE